MRGMIIERLAIAGVVLAGFVAATSAAHEFVAPIASADLNVADAVTSEELEQTNGNDPIRAPLPIQPIDVRGPDLSFKPLNAAPRTVLIRIVPTSTTTAN